ncbi:hypothetical protein Ab1vBOLIVR5_gp221c [Agrobacterium phage OLIVR5]|uniref:Uncharacterized protein n=3 Tax=Caudoviricetes TaxID=2731619 RepID=A0A858MTE9_9CAUD|nr:hypothetical protein KNU99_gp180 [Agrobacterium phage OLIVR5]QIW87869.1 hypothetical protein Ab1vBOLIVR5_gp221c [Agrobacterium phage OLIVR5]QIW88134.1 hypothetical protein Ab1vBOLIVR6_gp227c [Agrobacterium phage OLIVR6]
MTSSYLFYKSLKLNPKRGQRLSNLTSIIIFSLPME